MGDRSDLANRAFSVTVSRKNKKSCLYDCLLFFGWKLIKFMVHEKPSLFSFGDFYYTSVDHFWEGGKISLVALLDLYYNRWAKAVNRGLGIGIGEEFVMGLAYAMIAVMLVGSAVIGILLLKAAWDLWRVRQKKLLPALLLIPAGFCIVVAVSLAVLVWKEPPWRFRF